MYTLVLHPECQPGPINSVTANILPTPRGCQAEFRLKGDVSAIFVPDAAMPERRDFLWQTTCFEIFWRPEDGAWYREFNLSPSSCWAAYDFDDFRLNSRDAPVEAIAVACSYTQSELVLRADIAAELRDPAQVALNAIVEDSSGNIQFWALAFPEGKPEFHSEVCRKLSVERQP
ncbi:MAG: hypothetical protein ACO25F_04425 [Erythrobacter sp.]